MGLKMEMVSSAWQCRKRFAPKKFPAESSLIILSQLKITLFSMDCAFRKAYWNSIFLSRSASTVHMQECSLRQTVKGMVSRRHVAVWSWLTRGRWTWGRVKTVPPKVWSVLLGCYVFHSGLFCPEHFMESPKEGQDWVTVPLARNERE